ncbi:MAG: cell division protein ZapB [Nitrospiraceae bacterium]|nr:MAG: cell division protein ZapB [Nitrospiraceae bacterium]
MDKLQMLEEKITKVIDRIRSLTEENEALNGTIAELKEEILQKNDEIKAMKRDFKSVDSLKLDIEKLHGEREAVRSQVESLIKELESVEF